MISIKDVAKLANVSISTVSNVINNTKYVSDELKSKVNLAINELGYEVNPIAHNMKNKQTKTIGIITANMCGILYPYIIRAIDEVLSNFGYSVIIFDSHNNGDVVETIENEKKGFKKLIANKVDGIIFTSAIPENLENVYFENIKNMISSSNKRIELVSIMRDFTKYNITSVFTDNFAASVVAVEHLFEIGCKNIGHITGPTYSKDVSDKLEAFKTVVKAHGYPYNETTMVAFGDFSHQSGYLCVKALLEANPSLDGIFVANDQMAVGVFKALSDLKKRAPQDIKIIGYDNSFLSSILEPSLSTIDIHSVTIGQEAAKALLKNINNNDSKPPQAIKVDHTLVARKSTMAIDNNDWMSVDW